MSVKTLLIVDDDPLNIKIINEYLLAIRPVKYELLNANNAQLALTIALEVVPDLILTDWEMPVMNGIELIKALKKDKITKDIPVIMATGIMVNSEDLDVALSSGAIDYIRKPIDEVELIARIRTVLEMSDYTKEINLQKEIYLIAQEELHQFDILQLKNELDSKEQELASSINSHINNENKAFDLKQKLAALKPHLDDNGKRLLHNSLAYLKQQENQISLVELENKFDHIHNSFYQKLEAQCSEITKNDKILTTFMVLGFTPVEIAIIIKKSPNSVNVGFSRIRNKLNIKDNRSLRNFLKTLKS
ncbi:MAG: response regulator [Salibacteraceae bacterium]|nr:response regulator [Salibacteraceae bacterium]|tara:strand:+ start:2079 stop:2990 length:912 start_codon:yes stop_codon:yes gene_type:complete